MSLIEFRTYTENIDTVEFEVLVCGDLNFWVDDIENDDTRWLTETMHTLGFIYRVKIVNSQGRCSLVQ